MDNTGKMCINNGVTEKLRRKEFETMTEIHLTAENFEKEVLQSEIPVLVDFYAEWCGPCKMLSPVIDEIAKEYEGKAKICRVNVDEEMELAQQYRVMSVPTVLVFKNGQVSGTSIGYVGKEKLTEML